MPKLQTWSHVLPNAIFSTAPSLLRSSFHASSRFHQWSSKQPPDPVECNKKLHQQELSHIHCSPTWPRRSPLSFEILKASLADFNRSWAGNLRCHQGTTTRDPGVRWTLTVGTYLTCITASPSTFCYETFRVQVVPASFQWFPGMPSCCRHLPRTPSPGHCFSISFHWDQLQRLFDHWFTSQDIMAFMT